MDARIAPAVGGTHRLKSKATWAGLLVEGNVTTREQTRWIETLRRAEGLQLVCSRRLTPWNNKSIKPSSGTMAGLQRDHHKQNSKMSQMAAQGTSFGGISSIAERSSRCIPHPTQCSCYGPTAVTGGTVRLVSFVGTFVVRLVHAPEGKHAAGRVGVDVPHEE